MIAITSVQGMMSRRAKPPTAAILIITVVLKDAFPSELVLTGVGTFVVVLIVVAELAGEAELVVVEGETEEMDDGDRHRIGFKVVTILAGLAAFMVGLGVVELGELVAVERGSEENDGGDTVGVGRHVMETAYLRNDNITNKHIDSNIDDHLHTLTERTGAAFVKDIKLLTVSVPSGSGQFGAPSLFTAPVWYHTPSVLPAPVWYHTPSVLSISLAS